MSGFRKCYGVNDRLGTAVPSVVSGEDRIAPRKYTSATSEKNPSRLLRSRVSSYKGYNSKREELDKNPKTESYLIKNKPTENSYLDKKASASNYPDKRSSSTIYAEERLTNRQIYADKKAVTASYLDKKPSALSYLDKKPTTDSYMDKKPITRSYIDKQPNLKSYIENKSSLDYSRVKTTTPKSLKSTDTSPINSLKFNLISYSPSNYNSHSPNVRNSRLPYVIRSKSPQEKDIPKKTDSTGYSPSCSSYKTYSRSNNITRPVTATEPGATTSRFGYSNRIENAYSSPRLCDNIPSSNIIDKSENRYNEITKYSPNVEETSEPANGLPESKAPDKGEEEELSSDENENATRTYSVITRHTSPTPPGSSLYVRTRRADMAKTEEETITRLKKKPPQANKNVQTDDSRSCRFSIVRTTPARTYIDTNPSSNYLGYAGRYSTQYTPNSRNSKSINSETLEQAAQKNEEFMDPVREGSSDIVIDASLRLNKTVSPVVTPSEKPPSHGSKKTDGPKTNAKSKSVETKKNTHKVNRQNSKDSNTLSLSSSSSEDEYGSKLKKHGNITSTSDDTSSRTSADESSISLDRPSAAPSIPEPVEPRTKEAKTFLIKALTPITNLFKSRSQDSGEKSISSESTTKDVDNITLETENTSERKTNSNGTTRRDSCNFQTENVVIFERNSQTSTQSSKTSKSPKKGVTKITRVESGERAWWLDSSNKDSENVNDSLASKPSFEMKISSATSNIKTSHRDCDEQPWWLDSCAKIPDGIETLSPSSLSDNKLNHLRHIDSGERDWWESNSQNTPQEYCSNQEKQSDTNSSSMSKFLKICHAQSGEKAWWLSSNQNVPEGIVKLSPPPTSDSDSDSTESGEFYTACRPPFLNLDKNGCPLGDRIGPEGVESPDKPEKSAGRISPIYDNDTCDNYVLFSNQCDTACKYKRQNEFISRYTDIDDLLGTSHSPFIKKILAHRTAQTVRLDSECKEIDAAEVKIHDSTPQRPVIKKLINRSEIIDCSNEDQLDDASLQLLKDGNYGPYLDLDSSLTEQQEEFEGMQDSRKNAIVLRTQLSVRVHSIIERLRQAQGRDLRRALFSLKQILQADKDLVHEFVANNGLDCLIQVGTAAEHDFLNYILRALGQIVLYVDGMHGVMEHKTCLQWLYSLIGNKFRHVVKTALKLLLVFVEYTEQNSLLLIHAVHAVDIAAAQQPWYNIMKLLKDFNAADTELLIYAMTLINKCLNGIPDQDTYYDQADALEEQGIDEIIQRYMSKQGTDLDLLRQFQIYEAVLSHEDGDSTGVALKQLDETIIKAIRHRSNVMSKKSERRKSKRQNNVSDDNKDDNRLHEYNKCVNDRSPIINCTPPPNNTIHNTISKERNEEERLRRRRERYVRQGHHIIQQQELFSNGKSGLSPVDNHVLKNKLSVIMKTNIKTPENTSKININGNNQIYTSGLQQRIQNGTLGHTVSPKDIASLATRNQKQTENGSLTVKDLTQRLSNQNNVQNSPEEKISRVSDMTGLILKAKEGLAKSQSKDIVKSPTVEIVPKVIEIKTPENELHWEELRKSLNRNLELCDLDFTDLRVDDDDDLLASSIYENGPTIPPPPPPIGLFNHTGVVPPPPPRSRDPLPPPSLRNLPNLMNSLPSYNDSKESDTSTIKKNKKTVKLFWKEVKDCPAPEPLLKKVGGLIWEDLPEVSIDTKMLEHLFESKTNDLLIKKLTEPKNNVILDAKRSNAINIGMKKMPTPRTIKTAILKMDTTVISREGIEKLLNMQPSEEERIKIQEAQYANPDLPLGSAEQFLLALASITELASRLKLWAFKLDFEYCEKEIAEPLMDLKQGIELLKANKTFKIILSTLRSVGSFLNGTSVKGFRLEYLSKVMEVKDTVQKHPLLHHICQIIMDKFPDTSDFFSEVGPVIRASKVDFEEIGHNLVRLETDCKSSWDHLKKIAKHDGQFIIKSKINEFLTDAAERIILLGIIRKRVMNRYNKFLLHIGVPLTDIPKTKPSDFLKIVSEFALEYRTSRERVLQQLEKKANHRERNKTRGKMIIHSDKYGGVAEVTADVALHQLIMTNGDDSYTLSRKKSTGDKTLNGDLNAEDEIFESLVKSTMAERKPMIPRDRKRARIADRKSLKRSRTRESVPQLDNSSTAS